jgi:hypothetical protein
VADPEELELASGVLNDLFAEVGERPLPSGLLRTAAAQIRAGIADGKENWLGLAAAAGLDPVALPDDDAELWLAMATGVARHPVPPSDQLSVIEWLSAIAAITIGGSGTQVDAPAMAHYVSEGEELPAEAAAVLEEACQPIVERWWALGALDQTERLTALGWWGLPEAQRRAWAMAATG